MCVCDSVARMLALYSPDNTKCSIANGPIRQRVTADAAAIAGRAARKATAGAASARFGARVGVTVAVADAVAVVVVVVVGGQWSTVHIVGTLKVVLLVVTVVPKVRMKVVGMVH